MAKKNLIAEPAISRWQLSLLALGDFQVDGNVMEGQDGHERVSKYADGPSTTLVSFKTKSL